MSAVLLLALCALSPTAAPAASTSPQVERVLVLDFTGLDAAAARAAAVIAASVIQERGAYDVVTAADVQALMDREANKQNAGCDDGSESCFAELASALGAHNVLHGSVASLGSQVLVTVSLFDADAGVSLGRKVTEVPTLNDVSGATKRLTRELIDEVSPPPPTPPALVWGGVVTGVGTVVAAAGLGVAAWAYLIEGDPKSSTASKDAALSAHVPASVVGMVGVGVVVVGASLITVGVIQGGP
jgi:hypothetical protein